MFSHHTYTQATFRPTPGQKKISLGGRIFIGVSTDQSRPFQTFSCVNDCKHLSIAFAESAEKCVGQKVGEERRVRPFSAGIEPAMFCGLCCVSATHTGQHSTLTAALHAYTNLFFAGPVADLRSVDLPKLTSGRHRELTPYAVQSGKATLHRLRGFLLPQPP